MVYSQGFIFYCLFDPVFILLQYNRCYISGFIRNTTIQEGCMKKIIAVSLGCMIGISLLMLGMAVSKDYTGCYICSGKSGTYVKYKGDDTFDKRKKAKALGCEVGGTSSSCDAANYTILGTVD